MLNRLEIRNELLKTRKKNNGLTLDIYDDREDDNVRIVAELRGHPSGANFHGMAYTQLEAIHQVEDASLEHDLLTLYTYMCDVKSGSREFEMDKLETLLKRVEGIYKEDMVNENA